MSRQKPRPSPAAEDARGHADAAARRAEIATAARALARLGYVHAFGHVSAIIGRSVLITPTRPPLPAQSSADILEVGLDGTVLSGDAEARPLEVVLHLGIYRARPDVQAICRAHPPAAALWWGEALPPVEHGFGGIVGTLAAYDGSDLIHTMALGAAAAQALGSASALFLRGNGALTVGRDVGEAAARMWSLEERCAYALRRPGRPSPFSEDELRLRQRWFAAEAARAWVWMKQL